MSYDVRRIDEELAACDINFREQCKIVYDGLKKGVKYDGCSGVPDFNFGVDCCGEHDAHYQLADIPRNEADARLRICILRKGIPSKIGPISYNSNWFLAASYWLGVRMLGWKFYGRRKKYEIPDVDRDVAGP